MPAGRPKVKSGSNIAKSGNIIDEETPFFSSSPTVIIDTGVTSDPVPAVVGIKTRGKRGPFAFATPHASSKFSPEPSIKAVSLATSMEEPPPKPITPVALIFFPTSIALRRVFLEGSASTSSKISTELIFFNSFKVCSVKPNDIRPLSVIKRIL